MAGQKIKTPLFLINHLSDREKAAVIFGMVRAFKAGKWPKHFNKDDRAQWEQLARIAKQILSGGAFNPLDCWEVKKTAEDELSGEVAL
jgi:hypothetical protein